MLFDWSRLSMEVAPLVSPVLLLAQAAVATDLEAQKLLEEMTQQRLTNMDDNARRLRPLPGLRPEIAVPYIRDVLFTYTSPELYEDLVLHRAGPWAATLTSRATAWPDNYSHLGVRVALWRVPTEKKTGYVRAESARWTSGHVSVRGVLVYT